MLTMTQEVMAGLLAHAREEAPIEACGYLAQADGVVCRQFPMANTDQEAEHFSMDPKEQFAVVRQAREDGVQVCAVYHSHPETPARPSVEDIRLAFDPDMSYVIVSLADNQEAVRSFRIRKGEVEVEEITVIP